MATHAKAGECLPCGGSSAALVVIVFESQQLRLRQLNLHAPAVVRASAPLPFTPLLSTPPPPPPKIQYRGFDPADNDAPQAPEGAPPWRNRGVVLRLRTPAGVWPSAQAVGRDSPGDSILRVWQRHGLQAVVVQRVRPFPRFEGGGCHRSEWGVM